MIENQQINLMSGNAANMRSNKLSLKKEFSFDHKRATNKTEQKKKSLVSSKLGSVVAKMGFDRKSFQKVKPNAKFRKLSKSDKKHLDKHGSRSGSRKSRLIASSSSRASVSLEEMGRLRFDNDRLRHALGDLVTKFKVFQQTFSAPKTSTEPALRESSESGSSIVWESNPATPVDGQKSGKSKESKKDAQIAQLKSQLADRDSEIAQLRAELAKYKRN